MSYYTYFYPNENQYNPNSLNENKINERIKKIDAIISKEERKLRVLMLQKYYEARLSLKQITEQFFSLVDLYTKKEELEQILWIKKELEAHNAVGINHANCVSKYIIEEEIKISNKIIENCLSDLYCLVSLKSFKKLKEELRYLQSDFMQEIETTLESVKDAVINKSSYTFMLKYFDTKIEEKDL